LWLQTEDKVEAKRWVVKHNANLEGGTRQFRQQVGASGEEGLRSFRLVMNVAAAMSGKREKGGQV
jgi:hypothetical protein